METIKNTDVLIVGAGISGLTAAKVLKAAGKKVKILEASNAVGGRVQTDEIDGFLLDRGFQVLLTAYPEAKRFLDYKALDLRPLKPGAIILNESGITEIGDPLREPSSFLKTMMSPAGTLLDKLRVLRLKLRLSAKSIDEIFAEKETSTMAYLINAGFSKRMIGQFFKPFMTGIFLENQLKTSSRMFEFVFKMFSEGDNAIPSKGMGMIPRQLANGLTNDELVFEERVIAIEGNKVKTSSGSIFQSEYILIATDAINLPVPFERNIPSYKSVINIYFTADKPPFTKPIIALNALSHKLVNNIAVMDQISSEYCQRGKSLISVSLIGDYKDVELTSIVPKVINELKFWYPDAVKWKFLKMYQIPYALPNDEQVLNDPGPEALRLNEHCFICGDHLLNGSINAAMKSGRMAAEAIINIKN
ncbi:protoporphyrinogen oxidase [Pedobacter sp. CG_S7]|uniref:NAD(P)/FAD-dependent oxidoreductase n=1 Tax=Pedobacter sp. CG_S7 TaxID=3143930 RepID=UPI00339344B9